MDGRQLGPLMRAVRRRRGLRQIDVARAARVADTTVSSVERGHWRALSFETIERIAAVLDIRVDVAVGWRGGDADRLLNRAHSALAESFAAWLRSRPGWIVEPEVSFSIYGERGLIDQLGWHAGSRHLLVIEFKTELVDVNELLGTFDRKIRLAHKIARERGWPAEVVSGWLVMLDSRTSRRHVAAHEGLIRGRFPADARALRRCVEDPSPSATFGLAFWTDSRGGAASQNPATARTRIRVRSEVTRANPHPAARTRPPEQGTDCCSDRAGSA
jgi:transcriptional regulator with XRE-family HTH domain